MDSLKACLEKSIIFNSLDAQGLDALLPLFSPWRINPGEVLAQSGQAAQFYYLLEKGTLLLSMEEGKAVVLNAPSDFAGFSLMSRDGQATATVTVLEQGRVWAISCEDILEFARQETPAAAAVAEGWRQYVDEKAAFVSQDADADAPAIY